MMTSTLLITTVKSKPSFKYEVARLFELDNGTSLLLNRRVRLFEWTSVTPYKLEMASKTPSPPGRGR
jgi:hypothetical protein